MSSDPKKPPFDAPPGETPDLLQQDVSLDRRRRVPTFEELQRSGGESTTDPVRPAVPAPPKQTGIPMGTVPARPSSLDTGLNPQRVPPGMTPRQAPLSIEPTTDPVRPALARPATTHPVPTVPPPAPGARPPPAPPPPPRSSASAAGLPQVPRTPSGTAIPQVAGGAQAPGMRTPPPAPGGAPRSAPSASGTPQVPGGAQAPGMRTPPPAPGGAFRSSPSGSGTPAPPTNVPFRSSPSGSGTPAPPTNVPFRSSPSGSGTPAPPTNVPFRSSPSGSGIPPPPPPVPGAFRNTPSGLGGPPPRGPDPITVPVPAATRPLDQISRQVGWADRTLPIDPPAPVPALPSTGVLPQHAPAAMLDRTGVLPPNTPNLQSLQNLQQPARVAPPSPTEFAQNRPAASMQNLPQVTPTQPFQGALPPEDHRRAATPNRAEPSYKPPPDQISRQVGWADRVPVPLGGEDEIAISSADESAGAIEQHDEPKTVPASTSVPPAAAAAVPPAAPAPKSPSYATLPPAPQLPPEMLVTQPGLPGPFAARGMPANKAIPQRPASLPEMPVQQAPLLPSTQQPPPPPPTTGQAPAFESTPHFETADERTVTAEPASLWRRVGAWMTDLLFVSVLVLGLLFLAVEFVAPKNLTTLQQLMVIAVPAGILTALIAFVYTALFAFLWDGRTPGRRMMGIHLVDATGQAPSALRSLIRAALSLVSFALFLSGFWLALFDRHGQTLHDKLTRTFVVKLQDA